MKRPMFTLAAGVLATGVLATGAGSGTARALDYVNENDCFPTPAAVMAAHPDAAHVSWAAHTNPRCYFADRFKPGARETAVQQPAAPEQAGQQTAMPQAAAQPPATQQYGIFGIPLGVSQPAAADPAAQPPAAHEQQEAVQEPVVTRPRRHAARPQPRPAVAAAPAPHTTAVVTPAPRTAAAAVPQPEEAPAAEAAAAPRVTATPPAPQNAVTRDLPDDTAAADFESRFSASGYHR